MSAVVNMPDWTERTYPTGVKAKVSDHGELIVSDTDGIGIAIYAAGEWSRVEIVEDTVKNQDA